MSSAKETKSLTPAGVDALANRWNDLDARQEEIDSARTVLRQQILDAVEAEGELADRSSKTHAATGKEFELRVTQSSETRVDQKAAREFVEACPRGFGEQVFRKEEKLVLIETPDRIPGGADLGVAVRRLFQQAVVVKQRSPKVEVRPLVPPQKGIKEKARHA